MGKPEIATVEAALGKQAGASFTLHGAGVSGGIAIGYAHLITSARLEVAHYEIAREDIDAEIVRLDAAIEQVRGELIGLHARAAAKVTQVAAKFGADVWLSRNGRRVNAKSIMGVMMLAAGLGTTVELEVDGADEAAALDEIERLFADKFGEGE